MYTHTSLGALKTQLASRLGDAGKIFWTDSELGVYLTEALRTWQAATAYWRERGSFSTVANTIYYDIPTQLPTLTGYNVTDINLVNAMQFHLLENVAIPWTGTEQFTLDDLTKALERRRNQLLMETGAVITQSTIAVPAPGNGRVPLADTITDVRRVVWISSTGSVRTVLWRSDEWEAFSITPAWAQSPKDPPDAYSVAVVPPLTVQTIPAYSVSGQLDLLTVGTPAALDPTVGVLMNVPDDFSWVVKWGALADLLGREGISRDPERAAYCERRWREGAELLRLTPSVLQVQVNDVPVWDDSLANLDSLDYGWMNKPAGTPALVGLAGTNLLVFNPIPNDAYGITVDVVRNAPIPVLDADQVQIGREHLDIILDYAQHLAAFKQGGAEFAATIGNYERLMRAAAVYNERLMANVTFAITLGLRGQTEETIRPSRVSFQNLTT